jgi:hypothetical protein
VTDREGRSPDDEHEPDRVPGPLGSLGGGRGRLLILVLVALAGALSALSILVGGPPGGTP